MVMYVRTPGIVRMAAQSGLDFVLIDLQHSTLGLETVADMCEVARACGIAALIRPSEVNQDSANRLLDIGADGFMFHDVTSVDQIRDSVRAAKYAPDGSRGISVGGPSSNYRPGAIDADLLRGANERLFVIAQIESAEGVANIDSILDGGTIDAVEIGKQDLSIALGVPGQMSHPRMTEATDTVASACAARDVPLMTTVATLDAARRAVDTGYRIINWRNDKAILLDSFATFVGATTR